MAQKWVKLNPLCWWCEGTTLRVMGGDGNYSAWTMDTYIGSRPGLQAAKNLALRGKDDTK